MQEVQDWLVRLHSRKRKFVFCWVPSHVGVDGNERADAAAKEAVLLAHPCNVGIPHDDYKPVFRNLALQKWQVFWTTLHTNQKLKSIQPSVSPWFSSFHVDRRAGILLTRLRIGHTYLTNNYLMASGRDREAPYCDDCHTTITVKHLLCDCTSLIAHRRRWGLMGNANGEVS